MIEGRRHAIGVGTSAAAVGQERRPERVTRFVCAEVAREGVKTRDGVEPGEYHIGWQAHAELRGGLAEARAQEARGSGNGFTAAPFVEFVATEAHEREPWRLRTSGQRGTHAARTQRTHKLTPSRCVLHQRRACFDHDRALCEPEVHSGGGRYGLAPIDVAGQQLRIEARAHDGRRLRAATGTQDDEHWKRAEVRLRSELRGGELRAGRGNGGVDASSG